MLRAAREKGRVTHKGKPIRLTADLLTETLQTRREWGPVFNILKEKNFQPRISYPAKLSFISEGEIKSFTDKQMLRDFVTISCELKADKDDHFKVDNDENEHQLSLRMVSLGAGAKDELLIVEAEAMNYEGSPIKVTLATLKISVQPMVSLGGFEITPPVVLRLKCGSGPVHISGQHLVAVEEDSESEDEEEEDAIINSLLTKKKSRTRRIHS
uniref:Nucleophosmin n=1 Tax=Theropithecus gelada TaxID=9565 RepID=A0A8D2FH10_THEGE